MKRRRPPWLHACLCCAIIARFALVLYSVVSDHLGAARFTDVDYLVFSDAARLVRAGQSPYGRATYRYTPLLAMALALPLRLHPAAGKLLFCLADLLVAR